MALLVVVQPSSAEVPSDLASKAPHKQTGLPTVSPKDTAKDTVVVLPNWGRYENPALPWSEDLNLDDNFTGFTAFEHSLLGGIALGADWAKRMDKKAVWVVAEDTTATELVNVYEDLVSELKSRGFDNYRVILLNPRSPSWRRLDLDKLESITDSNLMVVGYESEKPAQSTILEVGQRIPPNDESKKLLRFKKPADTKSVVVRIAPKGWERDIPLQPSQADESILELDVSSLKLPLGQHEFKFFIDGEWEEGDNRELWIDDQGLLSVAEYEAQQKRYAQILKKFPAPGAEAVEAWVDSHNDRALSERWQLFNTKDLMKLALVAAGAWEPGMLPDKKSPQNNGLESVHISRGYTPQAYFKNFHQSEFWNEMLIDSLSSGKNLQELVPNAAEKEFARVLKSLPQQKRKELVYDPYLHLVARSKALDLARRHYPLNLEHTDPEGYGPNYTARELGYGLPKEYGTGKNGRSGNALESAAFGSLNPANPPRLTGSKGLIDIGGFLNGFMNSASGHREHMVGEGIHHDQTHYGIGYAESVTTLRRGNQTQPNTRMKYIVVITAPPSTTELPELSAQTIREFVTMTPAERKKKREAKAARR